MKISGTGQIRKPFDDLQKKYDSLSGQGSAQNSDDHNTVKEPESEGQISEDLEYAIIDWIDSVNA